MNDLTIEDIQLLLDVAGVDWGYERGGLPEEFVWVTMDNGSQHLVSCPCPLGDHTEMDDALRCFYVNYINESLE